MTISSTTRKAGPYTGNGVQTNFAFAFKVFQQSDVLATRSVVGVETVLTLTTDYTVALNADQDAAPGGSITTTSPLANGALLVISSNVDSLQSVLVTNAGGFFPTVFNAVFDKLTILVQQLAEKIGRQFTLPITNSTVTDFNVPVLAQGVLRWKTDASALEAVLVTDLSLPSQGGNAGKFITTNGLVSAWSNQLPSLVTVGGATAAFPAFKRNGTTLEVRLADDSAYAPLQVDGVGASPDGWIFWNGRSHIISPADGNLLLQNNASNDFGRLQFGGTTASFPAFKRNGAGLDLRLADDSGYANLTLGSQDNFFAGFLNPTPAAGTYNDYAPAGYDTVNYLRLTGAGAVTLTGLTAGTSIRGRTILLENAAATPVTLIHNAAASVSANRFFCPASTSFTLGQGQTAFLVYTGGGWRVTGLGREVLAAARTYFVATTGNDANDGLSASTAVLTVQQAITLAQKLDFNGFTVTVSVADGTYAGQVSLSGPIPGQRSAADLAIQGNTGTPANVVFSYSGASSTVTAVQGGMMSVRGVKFSGGASTSSLFATQSGRIEFQSCDFGVAGQQVYTRDGGIIQATGNYTISGGAAAHMRTEFGGRVRIVGFTVTLTGTPAFATAFAYAQSLGVMEASGNTYSGAATGARYSATNGGGIDTAGGGATYLPGNAAGTATAPGWYA